MAQRGPETALGDTAVGMLCQWQDTV